MKNLKYILPIFLLFLFACEDNPIDNGNTDTFDRKMLLNNVAENMITPSYQNFKSKIEILKQTSSDFFNEPTTATLLEFRNATSRASIDWQKMALFEGGSGSRWGPSSQLYLRRYVNTYPTKPALIEAAITNQNYDLESNYVIQGLPALDYILHSESDFQIISRYLDVNDSSKRIEFINAIIDKMLDKTNELILDWETYKTEFVNNDGTSANSSFSKLLNGFTEYYEQQVRKAKLGGPLGKFTQGVIRPQDIEGIYSKNSKALLLAANQAVIDFYKGYHFEQNTKGLSVMDYLTESEIKALGSNELLADKVYSKLQNVNTAIESINGDYFDLVSNKDESLNHCYNAFQEVIILLKVEVFAALNTSLSYIDNDGD